MTFNTLLVAMLVLGSGIQDSKPAQPTIDSLLAIRHHQEQVQPADVIGDLSFLRRVSLDLRGQIPSEAEIQAFLKSPNREALIDQLLQAPEFSHFLSEAWTTWLIGYSAAFQTDREAFRIWLERQIHNDVSFRQIVEQMLTATGSVAIDGPTNFLARHYDQPVVAVCRSFLGIRLECAQCHDHPFDRWTQQDYQSMEKFFSPLRRRQRDGVIFLSDVVPQDRLEERPQFLTGARSTTGRYREELALHLTRCKPFARNFANRSWYFLMGQGIVDPPDDLNQENQPSNPELLELLTQHAMDTDFSIRSMFRVICRSQAYQRSTQTESPVRSQLETVFAVRKLKPLLPEQFVDSLAIALDRPFTMAQRRRLLQTMTTTGNLSEDHQETWAYRESVQQLLQKISLDFQERELGNLESIFVRFLTRKPTHREREICQGKSATDIAFALALGNEFCFNH